MNHNLIVKVHPTDVTKVILSGPCCVLQDHMHEVTVVQSDYLKWQQGTLVQNAFPYLSAPDREFLISGTSPKGWDELFGHDFDEVAGIVEYLDDDEQWEDENHPL